MWKTGDLIRDKETKSPYLVIVVREGITLIADLKRIDVIVPLGVVYERDYDKFARDMEFEEIVGDMITEALELKYRELPKIDQTDAK